MKWLGIPLVLMLIGLMPSGSFAVFSPEFFQAAGQSGEEHREVVVRGKLFCADQAERRYQTDHSCGADSHQQFLATSEGRVYSFLPSEYLTGMFLDQRVRHREFQITARLHAKDRLEIIEVQSVVNGRLHDPYYFCALCNITSYSPGPCVCCRQEYEFKEAPSSEQ